MKTLLEVLQAGAGYLASKGVETPRLVMEQWMAQVLGCPRLQLYLKFDTVIPEERLVPLREGIKRLGLGEPLQYVVGETEFMGYRFRSDRRALIPRPDTECLVKAVLECAPLWSRPTPRVVEIGTGSGCVITSLALARPGVSFGAIDIQPAALELAAENAALHGVADRVTFRQGDLLLSIPPGSLDAVVANLPYIPSDECDRLPRHIRDHEPRSALDGGPDGLDLIRLLATQAKGVLRPGGWIFLEIGFDQGVQVAGILSACGFVDSGMIQDTGHRDRVVRAVSPGE